MRLCCDERCAAAVAAAAAVVVVVECWEGLCVRVYIRDVVESERPYVCAERGLGCSGLLIKSGYVGGFKESQVVVVFI